MSVACPDLNVFDTTVYDRTLNPTAQAWFKVSATHLLERVPGYLDLLDRYEAPWQELRSKNPGAILAEGDVQVVVSPHPTS